MNSKPRDFKRILAVKLADFGDALLIEPALHTLHNYYPTAQLDVLTTKNGLPALERLPYLHQILTFDKYEFDNPRAAFSPIKLKQIATFSWQLTCTRYDAVVFFHHLTTRWGALKFAALATATLAPVRVGLDNQTGRAWFLNRTIIDKGFGYAGQSEAFYWQQLVETVATTDVSNLMAGDDPILKRPQFMVRDAEHQQAQLWLDRIRAGQANAPVVALYPGSGNYALARRWLPIRFAEVADGLVERFGAKIVLLGSASETDVAAQVQSQMHQPATLFTGRTTLYQAGALLAGCDLFIGNDGGLTHLAAVMNTPTIAIFGPTNPLAWKPYGWNPTDSDSGRTTVVQAPLALACRPCLYRGIGLGHRYGCAPRPCLTEISAGQVIAVANRLLGQKAKLNLINSVD